MSVPAAYAGVVLIWSTTPLAIKWSGEGPGFLFGVTGRMVLGTALCLVLMRLLKVEFPLHKKARHTYVAASMGIYGAMLSVYWGAQYIPSGVVAVLFGLSPIVTSILAALWLNERSLTLPKIAGMLLGLSGLVLVFNSQLHMGADAWWGIAGVVLAVLIHSTSIVWMKRIGASIPVLAANTGGLSIAVVLYVITWLVFDGNWPKELPARSGFAIVYLGVLGTAVGFNLYIYVLKHLAASTIALVPLLTPVTALVLGQVLNGEEIHAMIWVATSLIAVGMVSHQWGDRLFLSIIRRRRAQ